MFCVSPFDNVTRSN